MLQLDRGDFVGHFQGRIQDRSISLFQQVAPKNLRGLNGEEIRSLDSARYQVSVINALERIAHRHAAGGPAVGLRAQIDFLDHFRPNEWSGGVMHGDKA